MLATTFTLENMRRFADEAWGPDGLRVIAKWEEYNAKYFGGALRPVPLVISSTLPFGRLLAYCAYNPGTYGRRLTLNVPKDHNVLLADNGVLVHEMVHQFLFERGEDAGHDSAGWRREIMRLSKDIKGLDVWAGRSKTVRCKEQKKVIRINEPGPNGEESLTQKAIASWPHSCGIKLGKLGA